MRNLALTWALLAGLAGCEKNQEEMYPQDWFLAGSQKTIDWNLTTIELFDENTKAQLDNPECSIVPKASHNWDLPTYYVIDSTKESVIACVFPNQ